MSVRLDERNRPEPDVVVTTASFDPQRTWLAGGPAVHIYELDVPTRAYAPTGIVRDLLRVTAPFPIEIALGDLLPG